jgi:hypothetical protein
MGLIKGCQFIFLPALILICGACTTLSVQSAVVKYQSGIVESPYPKASDDATILLNLNSNIEKTTFYVDGKNVATGRRIKVLINKREHTIIAAPEGYRQKEEFIQPPYMMNNSLLSFTFLLEDRRDKTRGEKVIDISIQGIDDGIRSTKQQDYREAVLFGKREAIERAGVAIKTKSTVKNLVLEEDFIQSQSEAVLLPGYQIVDVGYGQDGFYHIVLIGKIKVLENTIEK